MKVHPPRVQDSWADCDVWVQSQLIAFEQIRDYEEQEERLLMQLQSTVPR